jgi:DNA-binding NarL/FixJ family response regulator
VTSHPTVLLAGHGHAGRARLRASLRHGGLTACGEADDSAGAVAAAARARPDICLLDAAMTGGPSHAAAAILRAAPDVRVVILAASATDAELLDAVAAGACGHVPADLDAHALTGVLRDVLAGRPAFPRRLDVLLVDALQRGS